MKFKLVMFLIIVVSFLMSCSDSSDSEFNDISGTYIGTIAISNNLKSSNDLNGSDATTIVQFQGDQIEVHCFGEALDTTLILDYYHHRDSVFVCHTGEEFENLYGHMKGQGHMSGGMMDDMHDDETEWMHHLNDEHELNDEHFGGFDLQKHSFSFLFKMEDGDYLFSGTK
ncbi:hypothetical protein [Marinifilum sp.]|uniref:hypothetical protein n=1 Tax=Marinifilum sp. TaxID=2033137 RepID=UPI003BABD7B1